MAQDMAPRIPVTDGYPGRKATVARRFAKNVVQGLHVSRGVALHGKHVDGEGVAEPRYVKAGRYA